MRPSSGTAAPNARAGARRTPSPLWVVLAASIVSITLAAHAWSYLPFIADDALITLRYAERLLEGEGLTWTDGQRLEGYSNLLWLLLCAGLGALGMDLIDATRLLGVTASAAVLLALLYAYPPISPRRALPAVGAGMAVALTGPFAIWSVGGLEQPLLAALLTWTMITCFPLLEASPSEARRLWPVPALLLALVCWSRADGAVFAVATCAGLVAARGLSRPSLALAARLASLPVVFCVAHVAFRLAYYGDWLPGSARAKVAFSWHRITEGMVYVGQGLGSLIALLLPALVLAWIARGDATRRRRQRLLFAPLVLWSGYVVVVGGDIFPGWRHLVPVVALLGLLLADGLDHLVRATPGRTIVAWAAAPVLLVVLAFMQHQDMENRRAHTERWEWDGQVIGELLREAFGDRDPLLAVDPAGTLPYFSKLPAIDMLGINDPHLVRRPPPDFGKGLLGHELGDGDYVLERSPDLVVFCTPSGSPYPCFRSGKQMANDPRFRQHYRLAQVEGVEPYRVRSLIWVRAEGGRVGIERDLHRVTVPGHLLMANPSTVARLGDDDVLHVPVRPGQPAGVAALYLGPGYWRMTVDAEGAPLEQTVRVAGGGPILASGTGSVSFELSEDSSGSVDVKLTAAENAEVDRLRFRRLRGVRTPFGVSGSSLDPAQEGGLPDRIVRVREVEQLELAIEPADLLVGKPR